MVETLEAENTLVKAALQNVLEKVGLPTPNKHLLGLKAGSKM